MRILRRVDYRAIPWKNGRGVAWQIAASPESAGYEALDWQVSRPDIDANTPFSHLPGLDRQFMLVAGRGVELSVRTGGDGADFVKRIDTPLEPFAFRGDWAVDCRLLDGPVQVFNVMTRRGRAGASVAVQDLAAMTLLRKPADETLLVFVAAGALTAYGAWGTETLAGEDAILVDEREPTAIAFAPAGAAAARIVTARLNV